MLLSYLLIGCDSPQRLFEKAKTTNIVAVFLECCSKIQDQKLIAELSLNLDTWCKRRAALDFITDKTMLEKVSLDSKDPDICIYAKKRLEALESGTSLDEVPKLIFYLLTIDMNGHISKELPKGSSATWDEVGCNVVKK